MSKPIDWAKRLREHGLMAEDEHDGWRRCLQFVIVLAVWVLGVSATATLFEPVMHWSVWLFVLLIMLGQAVSLVVGILLTVALGIVEEL